MPKSPRDPAVVICRIAQRHDPVVMSGVDSVPTVRFQHGRTRHEHDPRAAWKEQRTPQPMDDGDGRFAVAAGAQPDRAGAVRRGASILLIEDVDINRELFGEMLSELGHRCDFGEDGAQACELIAQLDRDPAKWDAVLMDLQMPVMDGLTATRAIRARGGRAATFPIIALTASAFEDEIRECHAAGMNDHLAKPVSIEHLSAVIERWQAAAHAARADAPASRPVGAAVATKFTARRRHSRERLVRIRAELDASDAEQRASLIAEGRQIAHFLAGCAGTFSEPTLGDAAAEIDHELAHPALLHPATH